MYFTLSTLEVVFFFTKVSIMLMLMYILSNKLNIVPIIENEDLSSI